MKYILYIIAFMAGLGVQFEKFQIASNLSYFDILILLLLIAVILKEKKLLFSKSREALFLMVIGVIQFLSTGVALVFLKDSPAFGDLFVPLRTLYYSVLVFVVGGSCKIDEKDLMTASGILCIGLLFNSYNVFSLYLKEPRHFRGFLYLNNSYINRNTVYYNLTVCLGMVLLNVMDEGKSKFIRFLFFIMLSFFIIFCMFTFSKGAYLEISLFVLLALRKEIKKNLKRSIALILLMGFALFFVYHSQVVKELVFTKFQGYDLKDDIRFQYKIDAMKMGGQYPILGVGNGNYFNILEKMTSSSLTHDPHDSALLLFAENGIFAMLLYFCLWFHIIKFYMVRLPDRNLLIEMGFIMAVQLFCLGFLTGLAFNDKMFLYLITYTVSCKNRIGLCGRERKLLENHQCAEES